MHGKQIGHPEEEVHLEELKEGAVPPFVRVTRTSRTTTTTQQSRTGIRPNVTPRTDRRILGDRVVDTTYARWKRSRNIRFLTED